MIKVSTNEFKWSTAEQVYPFEKDSNGNILYCKQINFGNMPNNGTKQMAHGIIGYTSSKVYKLYGKASEPSGGFQPVPFVYDTGSYNFTLECDSNYIYSYCGVNKSGFTGVMYMVYAK
jgi:hypothetical protein